jgi:hypothetical protein
MLRIKRCASSEWPAAQEKGAAQEPGAPSVLVNAEPLESPVQACLDWSFILSMPWVNPVDQVLFAVLDPTHLSCGVVAYL